MKQRATIISFVLASFIGVVAYTWYYHSDPLVNLPASGNQRLDRWVKPALQTSYVQPQDIPPPPPPTADMPVYQSPPEPARTLIGTTDERLKQIEKYLPNGGKIYTTAAGPTHLKAALVEIDLDDNGTAEMVIAHTQQSPTAENPTPQLTLSVLAHNGEKLATRQALSLIGEVLFNVNIDGTEVPLAVRDVTGDGHPEIIVASGGGASVGGQLQVFDLDGQSFNEIARIGGHFFNVKARSNGRASVITARWKDEDQLRVYQWNGEKFEQTSKNAMKQH